MWSLEFLNEIVNVKILGKGAAVLADGKCLIVWGYLQAA
jgi:hypothetical protein